MKYGLIVAGLAALLLQSCKAAEKPAVPNEPTANAAPILTTADAIDVHSYAKPLEARVTHVALDLSIDFETKRIGGTATLDIDAKPTAKHIILDDRGLEIEAITDEAGKPLAYKVGASDPNLGAPLVIAMGGARKIAIKYKSAPDSGALQ